VVDPTHDSSGRDAAVPIGVGGVDVDAHRGTRGGARDGVVLGVHGAVDACAHRNPDPRLPMPLQVEHGDRGPRGNLDGETGVVDRDENDWALRGLNRLGAGGVAGADGDKDVHTAAARVDQAGVQFDEFADADGSIEVEVTDGRGHAVAAAPVGGGG